MPMDKTSEIRPKARSNVYQFLALGFGYPDASLLSLLRRELHPLDASLEVLEDPESLEVARAIRSIVETIGVDDLKASYVGCFGHTISKECPPYGAEYGQAHIFQKSQTLADIAGFYKAFGLEPAPNLNERWDYISVELEFMHFLCLKEAYALARNHPQRKLVLCRETQAKFLGEHLGRWAFGFVRSLEEKAGDHLYGLTGRLLTSFLTREMREFGLEPDKVTGPVLQAPPEDETAGCQACPLADPTTAMERGGVS